MTHQENNLAMICLLLHDSLSITKEAWKDVEKRRKQREILMFERPKVFFVLFVLACCLMINLVAPSTG